MTSSKIEWTEHVWNTIVGCSRVSAGCDHCYAEGQVHRFGGPKTDASGAVIRPSKYDRASTINVGAAVRPGLTFLPTAHNGSSLGKGARWTGAVWQVGKTAAGRVLDGRTWDEMPERSET